MCSGMGLDICVRNKFKKSQPVFHIYINGPQCLKFVFYFIFGGGGEALQSSRAYLPFKLYLTHISQHVKYYDDDDDYYTIYIISALSIFIRGTY